jgi:flagellar hook-length control protein FliK
MDVTVRASQQARQSHVQEAQTESEELIEFGALFSQFNGIAQGLQSLGNLTLPSSELTRGMESDPHYSDKSSSKEMIQSDDADTSRQPEDDHDTDDVKAAHVLLSEQRQQKPKTEDSARNKQEIGREDSERKADELAHVLRQSKSEGNAETDHLSADAYVAAQTAQGAELLRSSKEDLVRGSKVSRHDRGSNQVTSGPETLIATESTIEGLPEQSKLLGSQSRPKGSDSMNHSALIEQQTSPQLSNEATDEFLTESPELMGMSEIEASEGDMPLRRVQSSSVTTNQNDGSLELSALNMATKSAMASGQVRTGADTVQLSAKGRTIGNLVGSNTSAKAGLRQEVKEPALARAQTPSRDVEMPEDVDKLSVLSQISDGLKLKFGGDQTLEVNLNPAELGRVRLQLEMQGDKTVNIKVSAEHAVIADLLNLNLNELKKDLLAQGVQVNHIEVDVDAHGQGSEQHDEQQTDSDEHLDNQTDTESNDGATRRQFSVQA